MAEGIILAAGRATRAKTNKLMLTVDNRPLICHATASMRPNVSKIIVVTGHYDESIREALQYETDVTCVKNTDYDQGMFASVKRGVFESSDDFFILPGDCPFVSTETFKALQSSNGKIRVPMTKKDRRRGHPIYMTQDLKASLLSSQETDSLKAFRNRIGFTEVLVDDDAILDDIDTINMYKNILTRYERNG